jgi:8-oxo-dGTP diphosphatase
MLEDDINYCPRCGTPVERALRFGRQRKTCPQCRWIFFADPKVAAAVLVQEDDKVLLVQRDNQPQRGKWTLPAGFVDAGEDPAAAAVRECLEETGLTVVLTSLLGILSGQEHSQGAHILIVYKAKRVSGELLPGDDALQADFFSPQHLPPLAFSTTERILNEHFKSDKSD